MLRTALIASLLLATTTTTARAGDTELCNINPDRCPGRPVPIDMLRADADAIGTDYVDDNYPDAVYEAPFTSCIDGHGWGSCTWHRHVGFLEVYVDCIWDNDEEVCDISVESAFGTLLRRRAL